MAEPDNVPHSVLSEQFQERLKQKRLLSAIFLTYQFDPGFFEQEVLPVLFDIPLSHAVAIRLMQLEDVLRDQRGEIAVYYDVNGLVAGSEGSAKLDVRRVPIRHRTGVFHPKNVLLLVEDEDPDEEGNRSRSLVIATMSANLTRSGWWENVEVCHLETIESGDSTRLRNDLAELLVRLRAKATPGIDQKALAEILDFLRKQADQRVWRTGVDGRLQTHFYSGKDSVPDFLDAVAGRHLRGAYLEIISPYFDDAVDCRPLQNLIERFQPKQVRVFLPRSAAGEALCRAELYESVQKLGSAVEWGRLPSALLKRGAGDDIAERFVHAKVYRFFTQSPKKEILFIGSANLTNSAHQKEGNWETGYLVEVDPPRRPDFWLQSDRRKPTAFRVESEEDREEATPGSPLGLRYHWDRREAEGYWDSEGESASLQVAARGIAIGTIGPLAAKTWTMLSESFALGLAETLRETSFVDVKDAAGKARILVQEEGMSHKPSLLLQLSAADILRYWSLLTPEQRAAFIEAKAPERLLIGPGADLVARARAVASTDTLFDRFAGFFHAFGCLERDVRSALDEDNLRKATYRLFGKKYDSLGSLLDRVTAEQGAADDVDCYVIVRCADQLRRELARDYPDFWKSYPADADHLAERCRAVEDIRRRLLPADPMESAEFEHFLDWFDKWFLVRAAPVEVEA